MQGPSIIICDVVPLLLFFQLFLPSCKICLIGETFLLMVQHCEMAYSVNREQLPLQRALDTRFDVPTRYRSCKWKPFR